MEIVFYADVRELIEKKCINKHFKQVFEPLSNLVNIKHSNYNENIKKHLFKLYYRCSTLVKI